MLLHTQEIILSSPPSDSNCMRNARPLWPFRHSLSIADAEHPQGEGAGGTTSYKGVPANVVYIEHSHTHVSVAIPSLVSERL